MIFGNIEGSKIEVLEVHSPASFAINLRSKFDAIFGNEFTLVVRSPGIGHVGKVSGDAKVCLELAGVCDQVFDLFDRSIAAKTHDIFAMRFGKTAKLRRVNYQFAASFDHGTEPVAGFAAEPKIFVMLVEQGDNASIFTAGIFDMNQAADLGGTTER